MYRWALADSVASPVVGSELDDIHRTRAELIEGAVRSALADAGPHARAIDLGANEGWFSHRLLEWGAASVLAVDARPKVIRRAELLREHFEIAPERLELRCADVFELDPVALGAFDVVLCLGLIYHVENPLGLLRLCRTLTSRLCVIESQLTRQHEPLIVGTGQSDQFVESPASFAAFVEPETLLSSVGGVLSLTPNRTALLESARVAGFTERAMAVPSPHHNQQYVVGDRAVLLAR
jgi:2-polyprenyl-3-methyl-5-hydroxy-6-metoxy-1,4-benzoquinol methylase